MCFSKSDATGLKWASTINIYGKQCRATVLQSETVCMHSIKFFCIFIVTKKLKNVIKEHS